MSISRYKLLIIVLIIIVFTGSFYNHKLRAPKRNYSDFHCFYVTGKRILGQENIYIVSDKEVAEFRYAPIIAVLMSGLALMNEYDADTAWFILNFSLLIISFICLKKLIIPEKLDFKTCLILYILVIFGTLRFILHNFDSGQSNILMMSSVLIGLYYISKKRQVLGSAVLAFSIMVKYTPLIFLPYFILKRKIKVSLAIVASTMGYLLLPSLFIGLKANFMYVKNLIPFLTNSSILDKITILDPKNQSLFSLFHRIFTHCVLIFHAPPMPFQSWNLKESQINLIFITFAIIIYLMILYNPKKIYLNKESCIDNINYAMLLICAGLFNLNAWMHNYIFLSMGYFMVIYYLLKNGFKDKIVLIFWLLSYILNIITIRAFSGKILAYKLHFYSPFTISALFAFLALLKIKFSSLGAPPRQN